MSAPPVVATAPQQTARDLIDEAQHLIPFLRGQADAVEAGRRLTPEVHAAFIQAGFYKMTTEPALGGPGLTLAECMRVLELLARGDGSSAWSAWAALGTPAMAAFLDEDGARELFSSPDAVAATSVAGMGRAVAVEGGYRVSGQWGFLSGIRQAGYAGGTCFVFDGDEQRIGPDGEPAVIVPIWPVTDCTVIDTWETTGLRGTGSDSIEVRDLFVPARRVADFGRPPRQGLAALHYLHVDNAANVTVAAMALGIAGAALEAYREIAATRRGQDGTLLADTPLSRIALSQAETQFAQARGHLYETVESMWDEVVGTGAFPGEAWLPRTALATSSAVDAAIAVVTSLYRAAGSRAIFRSSPLDRCLRDLFTLGAHKTVQHQNYVQYGAVQAEQ